MVARKSVARKAVATVGRRGARAVETAGRAREDGVHSQHVPWVEPQLATLVDAAPEGPEWLHEDKFDGFRILCRLEDGQATLLTRRRQDWTERFGELAKAASALRVRSALLDGEATILRPNGITSFQALQNQMQGTPDGQLLYFAFDLLFLNGADLRELPLEERKQALKRLLSPTGNRGARSLLRYTEHVAGDGPVVFARAAAAGLEGIVSKRRDQPYRSGRTPWWLKTKAMKRQEFVIGGFTEPEGSRTGIGALLVGFFSDETLVYAGKVGTGFGRAIAERLRADLDALVVPASPFVGTVREAGRRIHWVEPRLVAEISFGEMTADGKLRHPSFAGMRGDKAARDVVRERPTRPPTQRD